MNGEDWFVNRVTGSVMYLNGRSEINSEIAEQIAPSLVRQSEADGVDYLSMFHDEGGTDQWQNFGADDMFDTDASKISEGKIKYTSETQGTLL